MISVCSGVVVRPNLSKLKFHEPLVDLNVDGIVFIAKLLWCAFSNKRSRFGDYSVFVGSCMSLISPRYCMQPNRIRMRTQLTMRIKRIVPATSVVSCEHVCWKRRADDISEVRSATWAILKMIRLNFFWKARFRTNSTVMEIRMACPSMRSANKMDCWNVFNEDKST